MLCGRLFPGPGQVGLLCGYGHSLVCNPWGEILTDCGEGEAVRVVDLDLGDLARYRAQIPILSGRRTDLYRTKQQT